MDAKKIVITGGGTGGHVFPALAIAQEMKSRGFSILYIGSAQGMEAKLVPPHHRFVTVQTGAVKNQSVLKIVKTLLRLVTASLWAWKFLGKEKPAAVIGVGGYVSVPVCLGAVLRGIPLFLQEQNATGGIANRFLAKFAKAIFLGFEKAKTDFPSKRCVFTGNPLRKEVSRADFPKHDASANCLLVMGGSQGSHAINEVIGQHLEDLQTHFPGISILHQTGLKDLEATREIYQQKFRGSYEVVAFITDMAAAYAKASLVVARSGALTASELIAVSRPALLVPFPRKGQNDQTTNAYLLEKHGAAVVVEQGENFRVRFWAALKSVNTPQTLEKMGQNYSGLRTSNALATIGDRVEAQLTRSS